MICWCKCWRQILKLGRNSLILFDKLSKILIVTPFLRSFHGENVDFASLEAENNLVQ